MEAEFPALIPVYDPVIKSKFLFCNGFVMILKLWASNGNKIKVGMYKLWKGNRKKSWLLQVQTDKILLHSASRVAAFFFLTITSAVNIIRIWDHYDSIFGSTIT